MSTFVSAAISTVNADIAAVFLRSRILDIPSYIGQKLGLHLYAGFKLIDHECHPQRALVKTHFKPAVSNRNCLLRQKLCHYLN